jgi:hypothetical protein
MKETRVILEGCRVLIDDEYDGQITVNLNYNAATEEIRKFIEDAIREKLGVRA